MCVRKKEAKMLLLISSTKLMIKKYGSYTYSFLNKFATKSCKSF